MQKKLRFKPIVPNYALQGMEWLQPSLSIRSMPVSEPVASLIRSRAQGENPYTAFGSIEDVETIGYESLLPSCIRSPIAQEPPRVRIGSNRCTQPYEASLLNCSALSFGPMGKKFILALNRAAHREDFFQNTGEAGISPYHFGIDVDIESPDFDMTRFFLDLKAGQYPEACKAGDLVWQIGTGYFGCRGVDGEFSPEQFELKASLPAVKMIELKVSQGVEPRKDMPVKQVTPGIAKVLGISWEMQAKLQDGHSAFESPMGLILFIDQLRVLSGGKPVGIKVGLSHKTWFLAICKAILDTGIMPDFISLDGMEAGTAAATQGSMGFTGMPLNEALVFIHNALVGIGVRKQVKIIASGKLFTERDIITKLARGADLCATARGFLLAAGCDQQGLCYMGNCPKGIATQDPELLKRFDMDVAFEQACNYHRITLNEMQELLSMAGVSEPSQIGPFHLSKRVSLVESKTLDELYDFIQPGALLNPFPWCFPKSFRKDWLEADATRTFSDMLAQRIASLSR
jgi:glutamate synthase domain-containing protein 2